MTDLVVAVRRELAADTLLKAELGPGGLPATVWDTWIFQWRMYVKLEGTGKSAIVLSQRGGWAPPNVHNTMAFPVLQVEIFSDPTRVDGNPSTATEAEQKALALVPHLDRHLNLVQRDQAPWFWGAKGMEPALRILGSNRLAEPDLQEVPDGDGVVRALVRYGLTLG